MYLKYELFNLVSVPIEIIQNRFGISGAQKTQDKKKNERTMNFIKVYTFTLLRSCASV